MDSDQLFHCEDDEVFGFTNYNQTPSKLQRKKNQGRGRPGLVAPEIHVSKLDGGKASQTEGKK